MSLRVGLNFGSTTEDNGHCDRKPDSGSWSSPSAVLRAGRGLSSWILGRISPPSSPSCTSFLWKEPLACPLPPTHPPSSATFAINSLPRELLEEIFREYLHGPTAAIPSREYPLQGSFDRIVTSTTAKTTPFTLAHVCAQWRAITMSTPSLWSKLCAFYPEPTDISLFRYWLSLSSSCPLELELIQKSALDPGRTDAEFVHPVICQLLQLALQHSGRWRTLTLGLSQDVESLFMALSPSTSSLESSFPRVSKIGQNMFHGTPRQDHGLVQTTLYSPRTCLDVASSNDPAGRSFTADHIHRRP
ncbi:hypothetical protein NMY22_g17645 [Coprinellus aureogranulatus]|nr:hypothetical protein NMY22_g17645 [Coprinellus aureogranulatus]